MKLKMEKYMTLDRGFNNEFTSIKYATFYGRDEWISLPRSFNSKQSLKNTNGVY